MRLGIDGFTWDDLSDTPRLFDLALAFDGFVRERDAQLFERFDAYRFAFQSGIAHGGLTMPEESELLISTGRHLGAFLLRLFQTDDSPVRMGAQRDAQIARFKKEFVTKRVAKVQSVTTDIEAIARLDAAADLVVAAISGIADRDRELAVATAVNRLLDLERDYPRGAAAYAAPAEARASLEQIRGQIRSAGGADTFFDPVVLHRDRLESPEALPREAQALHAMIDLLVEWAAASWKSGRFAGWTSFRLPHPLVFDKLVPTEPIDDVRFGGEPDHFRRRDGFHLTDPRFTSREVADEAHYCIYCHERKKDSCSRGFEERNGTFRVNPLGMPLEGCPLDERIGEMNALRTGGDSVAALAVVMIDNPMCPGTGHRICNDCMRSCIFQKQDPVNIPQIETGVLTDVLFLPYGFEIYALLTRWNPLHVRRPVTLPYNGRNVLVVGLGPAGYTLAHYLASEGFGVVAIDGLKIEPLPEKWLREPIRDARELWDDLDSRVLAGFGGVSEYGITVRWDKNFLKVIRIALERKANLRFYGGVRFGGTVTIAEAFDELGFDHIAIAAGAGTPTMVRMKNNLARGIRKASDFLMALQLTGAFKKNSMANLQVRLPAVVIGGGLTAIDTATELLAYYPVQVEKILERYETLSESVGESVLRAGYDAEEAVILDEFLEHGRAVRAERQRALAAGEAPDFAPLVRDWGGVTIAYRKSMLDSPAYRLNYEEVAKAFEEGIAYAENLSPVEAVCDDYGHLSSVIFQKQVVEDGRWKDSGEVVELPARALMVAAGTSPNVIYEKEHPGTFVLDKWKQFFQAYQVVHESGSGPLAVTSEQWPVASRHDATPDARNVNAPLSSGAIPNDASAELHEQTPEVKQATGHWPPSTDHSTEATGNWQPSTGNSPKSPELVEVDPSSRERGFFTSYQHPSSPDKLITFYGDNHPQYAGNVVKAMASAKDGYPHVVALYRAELMVMNRDADAQSARDRRWNELVARLDDGLRATVHAVNRLTPTILEVIVRAPFAARHFEPGQFFRLQNFETHARERAGTRLVMEGLALTGAWTDPERGLLSLIILEMGGSSRLCASLESGEPVVVMGPTGEPTEIPKNETVLLAGGGLGNAVLFSIAKALKENGCRVLYFAGYKKAADVFKRDEIEASTDQVIWSVDAGDPIAPRRPQDLAFVGNIVQSIRAYAERAIPSALESGGAERGEGSRAETPITAPDEIQFDLRQVSRIIAIGSDGMMRAVKDARHGVLAPYLDPAHVGIGSINSPMQCMMKQVCAQCLQRHVDPVSGKESFVFSCFNQDQKLDEVDFTNLRARLRQNTVLEKLTNLWLTRLLAAEPAGVSA